ncbi:hypothetical protein [Mesorhizobium sp. GbtcB19]|uniref:hypothetical protein n=1 Tax=Mesorhizobium sp. GbtcB19 TaxID=2824764 RepID=UPI001C30B711|nr:hypothetical protein [Mesorhizobium sp. GbtcB19]
MRSRTGLTEDRGKIAGRQVRRGEALIASRRSGMLLRTSALTTVALALSGLAAHAEDAGLWQPQVRAIIGANSNSGFTALEGFLPIKQNLESVLFLDVRSKYDFDNGFGQDVGLGVRRIVNPDLMIGGYAYLNIQNDDSHQFVATTLGLEAITSKYDAHVNVYLPISKDRGSNGIDSTLSLVGNQLLEEISTIDHRTYAAWGIEGEVGVQAPIDLPENQSLRFDVGAYHFADPDGDDHATTGVKAGIEYTFGDVIGKGTSLTFTGEVRNDNRDNTQFAGSVRLTVPFSVPGSSASADDASDPVSTVSPGLRKRLNERVRGDIGVRLEEQDRVTGTTTRVAINAATNAAFGKFFFADGGNTLGLGTIGDPTTLDDAVTKAGGNGFIVALGGSGNITTSGVNLTAGQTVIGGGGSVQAKLADGSIGTYNFGGSNGTIQGTNAASPVITLASNNTLSNITITGGGDGIFGNNAAGTKLTDVTVTGTGGNGADFTGNSTNVSASNFSATGNGLDGLHIEDNGTYNFTGTTTLNGNADDGLDITGQGTYTFATVNAQNNTDRGITVQGTSSGGSFTTTGGTISGNGGTAVFIDPITAHVVLDSITQSGGVSGVILDQVSGSFTVNGATNISNTTGPAIAITSSPASIRFGDITITNPGADGMSFTGVNAAVVAGNIVISGLGAGTGLDFSGSQTNFTAQSLNLTGTGAAGSIGIDLAQTTGDASITITNGGSISGVDTGVRLGISGSLAHSANAEFSFGGGSIAGNTASLDARGLNQTLGLYAFGSTTFSGPQLFDVQNVIFIGSSATGSGDGSSLTNLATVATADAITDSDAIFVLVNDGTSIDASNGFSLSDGQTLASFGNGRSFSLGGLPINVTGDNVQHDVAISNPAGAATLTNSGSGAVVTAANGNSLLDFNISGGTDEGINATSINGLTIQGVTVSNVDTGLFLNGVTGTVSVDDLNVQNASQTGIELVASSATVNFTGNTTIGNATNAGLFAKNFDGTATFDDLDITGGGIGVGIVNDSSGTLTFGAASSITNTGDFAFNINGSTPNVTYNGTINQATAANAVNISSMTGGTATFAGKITASTGAANAIDLTNNAGGAINFTGGLDLTTDGGFAFSAIFGGTLTVTGSGNTVNTGAGLAEKGIQLGGAGGLTIGAAGVTFASVTVDGTGGNVSTGIVIENTSGGNVTFGGVNISRVMGDAIRLTNVASGIYSFNGTTTIAAVGLLGDGFVVQGSAATVNVANLVTTEVAGADVSLTNNTGTIAIGGTITNSGFVGNDGVVVSGGTAAITVSADISSSTSTLGTAVKVDGISGGSVTFSGAISSTGTGRLFGIGSTTVPTGGAISFTGPTLSATGGGGAVVTGLSGTATLNVTAPLSIANASATGLSVANVANTASATFGTVTVTNAASNGININNNAGPVTFGTTSVTMGSAAGTAGIDFIGTNADVSFGTTTVSLGAGANQTGIDFSGSSTTADFGVTSITGNGDLTSRGIDLSSTTGNKTITFLRGSSISNAGVGVELSLGGTTATSANANFTFGDGTSADGRQSTISAAAGGYTVNTIGLDPTLGNYDFDDVAFTGSAHLASAVGGVIMVSQNGGVIAAGTNGLSADVTTISVAAADAMVGTQTFAFVGAVDLSSTAFTLDSGQSIDGFGNGNSILTSGTVQPINVQGNLGATGGNVTGDEGVVTGTGDFMHLLGSNQVKNTAFDFSGASGSVFLIDQNAAGFSNAGGIFIDGVTVSNVAAGQTAFKVDGLTTNLSISNNNINVAGTLLNADGGNGNITLTRGTLPNSATPGTLTGGGISIANRTGGLVNFTDKVTVNGNGVSLTNNTGATVTFADVDISTNGVTAFTATGGGTVNVTTGTINATNAQAVALDGITAGINFASTSATFASGSGIDLQHLSGTAAFGTGTLTNTGSGTAFNVGSATAASGGNAAISYGGTIASNGTGAAVSIQGMTGGSVALSGNLTDGLAGAGGNIVIAGNDSAAITFSGSTKQINSGATDGVNIGFPGGFPVGTPSANTNSTINFTGGGLDITTTSGAGFEAIGDTVNFPPGTPSTITVTGTGNKINSGGDGLLVVGTNVGGAGVTFDSITAQSTTLGAGVLLQGADLAGDVNIGGLKDTGYIGASLAGLTGSGVVNFTGTTDLDVSNIGFDISGQVGTINIANVAGSTLTIDGGSVGIDFDVLQTGIVNVGNNGGTASIGATTSTSGSAIALSGGNDLVHATLNYNGSIKVDTGSVLQAGGGDWTALNMSGEVVSTSAATGIGTAVFTFGGKANGVYNISSTINHTGDGIGVLFDGSSNGTATFSGTSKIFNTSSGTNDAVVKAPNIGGPDPQTAGTLAFTNGGLVITTSSGAGFTASTTGPGTVSVSGAGNTITTGTGTALDLANATVGAGGINFDTISSNGAATGVSLDNVSGGTLNLGAVDLQNITSRGVDVSGTLGSTLNFTSLNIGLNVANAIGLDLNGAALGSSNITANDFDVDGGSFAGTIGIDMAGTTGTGTIQLGDTVNNNPAGQTSTIANVGYGVQFSSATNAKLVFGDGQGPAESSIATTGGQVIHATDSLPTNGDYNFNDVNFTGDTSNLASIHVYYVDLDGNVSGTGDGSLANPGSLAQAQASTANVVVLIDKNVNGSQETLDLSGGTFNLDDGQVLLAFKSGDAAIDVSQLGVSAGGGASGVFHFTTVQNSTIVDAPAGIDTLRPILQSNNATSVINLATSGTGTFTGGIENLIIRNTGSGDGVAVNATAASSFFIWNNDIAAGGNALDLSTAGAPANTLLLSIDGNTLRSTASGLAASFSGQNISATDNSIAIRSFAGNKVTGGAGSGGIAFNNVRFDSDGAGGTVSAGTLGVGNPGARVQGNGLSFTNTSGTLDLGTLSLANTGGTGVLVDTKGANTTFTLNSSAGVVTTVNGAAFDLDPLTVNLTFSSVSAAGGTSGIIFDGVAGTFTVTGATSISNMSGIGISSINTNTGTFNFNTVTVNNAATTGGGIGWASGTLNISGLANIDTTSGIGLSQSGGTTSFTGGLTIDTTTGTGIFGNGGTIGITATAGAETVNSTLGQAIDLGNMQANIALDSTSSGGGGDNVSVVLVDGTLNLGSGTLTGATSTSFNVNGGTAAVSYSGDITKSSGSGAAVIVQGRFAGAGLVALSGNLTSNTSGIVLSANSGGTVTVSGASNNFTGAGFGIAITGNSGGTYNINGASYTIGMTGSGTGVSISGNSAPVAMNFGGGLAITTAAGTGFSATGAGTLNVTGSGNTISTGTGVAVNMSGVTIGAGGVNFSSTSNGSGGTSGVVLTNVTGSGTVNLGAGSLVGGSAAAVAISGGSANLIYSGDVSQATAGQALVSVAGGHTGTVTFNTGTLSATNGTGLQFDNADGTYNFNGTTTLNGGDAGVDILNGSGGTFTFGSGTSITSPTGTAFNVVGGTASVTYSGNMTQANNAAMVSVSGGHATGTITFQTGTLSATNGTGLQFDNADGAYNFNGTTTLNGGDAGIDIVNGSNGTFSFSTNTSITNPSGVGFNVNGGAGTITYAGTISKNNANNIVSIQGRTGGTTTLSGSLTATGSTTNGILVNANSGGAVTFSGASKALTTGANTAVNLTGNTGATIDFTNGGLVINTTSGTGFNATGGGTVTVQGAGNTITSTTGTALNIANTTIGANDVTFRSITSNGGSANGIILDTTGSSGGLHVTGTGSAGSGGTIANKTGADGSTSQGSGIYLNGTSDVQLAWMQMNDFQNYGILGNNVAGMALTNVVINGTNGNSVSGVGEGDAYFTGLSGSATVTNSTFTGARADAFHVFNNGETLNRLTITGSTFATNAAAGNDSNDAIGLQATGGTFNVTIQNSTINSARSDLVQLNLLGTVTSDLVLTGNTMNNANQNIVSGGGGLTIGGGGPANNVTLTYNISNNTISGAHGAVIAVTKGTGTNASFVGTISGNIIGTQNVAGSGSTQGYGIAVFQDGAGNSSTTITNNQIHGTVGGIYTLLHNGSGTMTAVIQGNTVDTLDQANSFAGVYVQTGSNTVGGGSPDSNRTNVTLGGAGALANTVNVGANASSAIVAGIVLEQEGNSKVGLIGSPAYAGGPYAFSTVQNYIASMNNFSGSNASAVFAFGDPSQPAGGGYFVGPLP